MQRTITGMLALLVTVATFMLGMAIVAADAEAMVAQRLFPADAETVTVPVETMIWQAEEGIEWYRVTVTDASTVTVYDEWLEVAANCVDGVCVAFPPSLTNGTYTWLMDSWDGSALTGYDAGTTFTLDAPATEPPFINVPLSTPIMPVREFLWEDQPQAQWYNLVLVDAANNTLFNEWYEGRDVCQGLACGIPAPTLFAGNYILTITAWGPANITAASAVNFTVPDTVPADIYLVSPFDDATVTAPLFTLTWDDAPDRYWYRIFIISTNGTVYGQWLNGAEVCNGGECELPVVLLNGDYTVWLAAWGPANTVGAFTATSFTVGNAQ